MHAEIALLSKLGDKVSGCKFYVYRFNNSSCPKARLNKNGKPCPLCQHALRNAGVSRVIYVDNDGEINTLKNRDMTELVGQPSTITNYFLDRHGDDHHGKFMVNEFISV